MNYVNYGLTIRLVWEVEVNDLSNHPPTSQNKNQEKNKSEMFLYIPLFIKEKLIKSSQVVFFVVFF